MGSGGLGDGGGVAGSEVSGGVGGAGGVGPGSGGGTIGSGSPGGGPGFGTIGAGSYGVGSGGMMVMRPNTRSTGSTGRSGPVTMITPLRSRWTDIVEPWRD